MPTILDTCHSYLDAQTHRANMPSGRKLPVITLSREAGAGAVTIARLIAQRLDQKASKKDSCRWTVFDRSLVERVLEDHELPAKIRKFMPEDASVFSLRSAVEELLGLHPSDWTLVQHTTDSILRLAALGNVILVGRGANVITANFENAFHVRLVAPKSVRIKQVTEFYQLTEREAAIYVREKDRARRRYVKVNFHVPIDDPLQYHITINTASMSHEKVARMIADAVLAFNR